MKRALLIVALSASAVSCRSVSPLSSGGSSADAYEAIILANQQCYGRFSRIDRLETITVLNRDQDGNVAQQHSRDEIVYGIVEMANDRSSLGGVTAHPFFSSHDTFSVITAQDGKVFVRVDSAEPRIRHYLDNIIIEMEQGTGRILGLTSDMFIHGYFRDGGHSVTTERLIAEWTRTNGCDLPKSVRYHSVADSTWQRPRLTTEITYEFESSPSPSQPVSAEEVAAFEEALAALGASLDYSGPTAGEIEQAFAEHRAAFDELEAMLREDRSCTAGTGSLDGYAIEVGVDTVCDFWEREGRWDRFAIEGEPVWAATRDEMLRAVNLTPERYERYLLLLGEVGAKRASIYSRTDQPAVPTYRLGGAGWVASSYYVNIVRLPERPEPVVDDVFAYIEREGYGTYKVYSELGDNWYVEMNMMW